MIELNNSYNNGFNEMIDRNPKYTENKKKEIKVQQIGSFCDTIKLSNMLVDDQTKNIESLQRS